ncbi:hypothetical protein FaHV1S18_083 [Falconid herpesvirus 1]|uniref:Uncharacterized protein n=2 Tax=Columbid alphaherpesvirus 1 TaxID=93386 RepID=A0A068EPF7_9ALPH|nr:hypothetical protein FaHV1S18_003 [Falconid herpesvirus 1]YP_009046567.1 hypothetical protein FaHV1S18_083 [Falconid herpesvirus 1]YP_009352897.1 hypothetical protein CoHVHLJ_003 [Columbid alphaherpesvirus 1]YP_009352977.1 hypothetical protein CoHVHLJ_083 [Columbid alphaherpesvirus 1]AID52693.1 hypothetical protein FaHV1S18_003 [Falconid herpesvirus 1]AID52773.1 hypothetical protein FaHV1S18_083 [Falconid herpesvirus 1]ARD71314.1 hypothetical protein CoHVHLJ_003 [Columbid alphaherpesvirus 
MFPRPQRKKWDGGGGGLSLGKGLRAGGRGRGRRGGKKTHTRAGKRTPFPRLDIYFPFFPPTPRKTQNPTTRKPATARGSDWVPERGPCRGDSSHSAVGVSGRGGEEKGAEGERARIPKGEQGLLGEKGRITPFFPYLAARPVRLLAVSNSQEGAVRGPPEIPSSLCRPFPGCRGPQRPRLREPARGMALGAKREKKAEEGNPDRRRDEPAVGIIPRGSAETPPRRRAGRVPDRAGRPARAPGVLRRPRRGARLGRDAPARQRWRPGAGRRPALPVGSETGHPPPRGEENREGN